jgi:hypothetical protein
MPLYKNIVYYSSPLHIALTTRGAQTLAAGGKAMAQPTLVHFAINVYPAS